MRGLRWHALGCFQPMIDPLYGGKSAHDVMQTLLANPQWPRLTTLFRRTRSTYIKGDFAPSWRKALHDGWVEGTAFAAKTTGAPKSGAVAGRVAARQLGWATRSSFRPDPSLYDGRYGNVGWLQELPKQVTNLSWDNAALMSMDTMGDLKLEESDLVDHRAERPQGNRPGADVSGPSERCGDGASRPGTQG